MTLLVYDCQLLYLSLVLFRYMFSLFMQFADSGIGNEWMNCSMGLEVVIKVMFKLVITRLLLLPPPVSR